MQGAQFSNGWFTGDGEDLIINLGYTPRFVEIYNPSAAGGQSSQMKWFEGMDPDAGVSLERDASGDQALLTTTGIKLIKTSDVQVTEPVMVTGDEGFISPSNMNIDGDVLYWRAYR